MQLRREVFSPLTENEKEKSVAEGNYLGDAWRSPTPCRAGRLGPIAVPSEADCSHCHF